MANLEVKPETAIGLSSRDQTTLYILARTMIAQARGRTVLNLNPQQQETHQRLHLAEPDIFPRVDTLLIEPALPGIPLSVDRMAEALNVPQRAVLGEAYSLTRYIRTLEGTDEIIVSLSLNERRRFRRQDLVGSEYIPQVVRSRSAKAKLLEYLLENQPVGTKLQAA